KRPPNPVGDSLLNIVHDFLANTIEIDKLTQLYQQFFLPFRVFPEVIGPDAAAIPLKNNREVYGPWYVKGPDGKVNFEVDESLTPWNYGGYSVMNFVGNAKVVSAVTNMQEAERGRLRIAGSPQKSVGDELI